MNILSKAEFGLVRDEFMKRARNLEKEIFIHCFEKENEQSILAALEEFQNEDGGFGHGIESDFTIPLSNPMHTSVALTIMSEHVSSGAAEEMTKKTINYLEDVFDYEKQRWFTVSKEVNDYPHAPWWNFDEEQGMTVIDNSWGNPTADLIGHLLERKAYVKKIDIEALNEIAIQKLEAKDEFKAEHEVYCYVELLKKQNDPEKAKRIEKKVTQACDTLICRDVSQWTTYVPRPLDFINDSKLPHFGISQELIDIHLDYYIELLKKDHFIDTNWQWGVYPEAWEIAKKEWQGVLTLNTLLLIRGFGRIEV